MPFSHANGADTTRSWYMPLYVGLARNVFVSLITSMYAPSCNTVGYDALKQLAIPGQLPVTMVYQFPASAVPSHDNGTGGGSFMRMFCNAVVMVEFISVTEELREFSVVCSELVLLDCVSANDDSARDIAATVVMLVFSTPNWLACCISVLFTYVACIVVLRSMADMFWATCVLRSETLESSMLVMLTNICTCSISICVDNC